jgi:hypothetical protein
LAALNLLTRQLATPENFPDVAAATQARDALRALQATFPAIGLPLATPVNVGLDDALLFEEEWPDAWEPFLVSLPDYQEKGQASALVLATDAESAEAAFYDYLRVYGEDFVLSEVGATVTQLECRWLVAQRLPVADPPAARAAALAALRATLEP